MKEVVSYDVVTAAASPPRRAGVRTRVRTGGSAQGNQPQRRGTRTQDCGEASAAAGEAAAAAAAAAEVAAAAV